MFEKQSKAKETAQGAGSGFAPHTSFDILEAKKRLRDEGFSALGAAGAAAVSRHIGEDAAARLAMGEEAELENLPDAPENELLYGQTKDYSAAGEESLGFFGGIGRFFSRKIDFSVGGAHIRGKNGYQVRGGSVFLFRGAALDLSPANLTGKREGNGVQSASGSEAVLFLSPVNMKSLVDASMDGVYLNSSGDISARSSSADIPLGTDNGPEILLHGLKLSKSGGGEAELSLSSLDFEAVLGELGIYAKNVKNTKLDGASGLSFELQGASLKDAQSPYPTAFFKPSDPLINVKLSKEGFSASLRDVLEFSESCSIRSDTSPSGSLICTMDEEGNVKYLLANLDSITFNINGRETVLNAPLFSEDGQNILYKSAFVKTPGFEPMEIETPGKISIEGFESEFRSKEASLELESAAGGTGGEAASPAEKVYEISSKTMSLISAVMATENIKEQNGSLAQKTGGQGTFLLLPLSFARSKDPGEEALILKEKQLNNIDFTHDVQTGISAEFGEVELETKEDEGEVTLLGLKLVDGVLTADSVKLSREGEGFKLDSEMEGDGSLAQLMSFSIPSIGQIEVYGSPSIGEGEMSAELMKKKLGAFKLDGFLDMFSLEVDFDEGVFSLQMTKEEELGSPSFNPESPITLAVFPLPIPAPPLYFSLTLEPEFKSALSFGINVNKAGGFGEMKEGDELSFSAQGDAGITLGIKLAGDLNAGVPGLASLYAGLWAAAGINGKKDDYAHIGMEVGSSLVKKDGKLRLGDDLSLDLLGDAALKGSVGFHAGARFLIWTGEFFEYTFKEWQLAAIEANTSFKKSLDSPGFFKGWSYESGAFSAEGFGKSFEKEHNKDNAYRFEAEETLSVSDTGEKFAYALAAVRAANAADAPFMAFSGDSVEVLLRDSLGKARAEVAAAAVSAREKLEKYGEEFEKLRSELPEKIREIFAPHRAKHQERIEALHRHLDRYGLSAESDQPLTREDMKDFAIDEGGWVQRLRDYENEHSKRDTSKHIKRRIDLNRAAPKRELWDNYASGASEMPETLEKELSEDIKNSGLGSSYGFNRSVEQGVNEALRRLKPGTADKYTMEDVELAIRFQERNVRSYRSGSSLAEGGKRALHSAALSQLVSMREQNAQPGEIIKAYQESLGTEFFENGGGDLISRRKSNAREQLLYAQERLGHYEDEQAGVQAKISSYTLDMKYLDDIAKKCDEILSAIDEVCSAKTEMLTEKRAVLEMLLEDGSRLGDIKKQQEDILNYLRESKASAKSQLALISEAMSKAVSAAAE